jgi:hypothetical protein
VLAQQRPRGFAFHRSLDHTQYAASGMGCGCLALLVALVAGVIFFIYASTDPGPPVEGAIAAAALATMVMNRTLGVPSRLRTARP